MSKSGVRLPGLDGLRGLAILLVVGSHISGSRLPYAGNVGVTLFFALSGYLITGILLNEHRKRDRIDLPAFYMRRVLRLYPALLTMLALFPAAMWAVGDADLADYWPRATRAALYVTDFYAAASQPTAPLTMTWSLAVEEQFYLVWPLVLIGLVALAARRRILLAASVWMIFGLLVLWRLVAILLFSADRVYFAPDTVAFSLLAGCGLAVTPAIASRLARLGPVALAATLALSVLPGSSEATDAHNVVAVFATFAAIPLVAWAATPAVPLFGLSPMRWFGTISYGWYLWHQPLMSLGAGHAETTGIMRLVAALAALLVAWASYVLVERPILRQKARFERTTPELAVRRS